MAEQEPPQGAVLPIEGGVEPIDSEQAWRMLAQDSGLLITWQDAPAQFGDNWGPVLRGTSTLSQQLTSVLSRTAGSVSSNASTLFRVEVPNGATLQSLVPAVGGGFRGLVRAADAPGIAGHARLIPVGGAATGAGIALGPLVGLMALSVGAEMLARHQQNKKLAAIDQGVRELGIAADETVAAQLESVEQALELGSAAVLDRVEIPSALGLGSACADLRVIKNRSLGWLSEWEQRAESIRTERGGVSFDTMRQILGGSDGGDRYKHFPVRVATLYRALTLDSRALVLTGAEATLRHPGESMRHLQAGLRRALDSNASAQERLKQVLWQLAEAPITVPYLTSRASTERQVKRLDRTLAQLAAGASKLPDAPGLVTAGNRQVLELLRKADGSVRVLQPPASAARG
jgi:hypothetical protein